jgi:hypothetical protein
MAKKQTTTTKRKKKKRKPSKTTKSNRHLDLNEILENSIKTPLI